MASDGDPGASRRASLLQRMTRSGLYLVTDDRLEDDELLERLEAALEAGADVNAIARMTDDCREGVARFLKKK